MGEWMSPSRGEDKNRKENIPTKYGYLKIEIILKMSLLS
jgi:hypothetical protein